MPMAQRTYGDIDGYPLGSTFANRADLAEARVHRPTQGGICGGRGRCRIDRGVRRVRRDEDYGDEIVYTGQGGNDPGTKRQVADQVLALGNAGLARSQLDARPVRVIRGAGGDPIWSPPTGFRYDGLFRVVDHWHDTGQDGYRI
jgi:putative restriction endonuclease